MFYKHSEMIAGRVDLALRLIETGDHSTKSLAAELGVSVPTASRVISALRQRGYSIKSVKNGKAWTYRLMQPKQNSNARSQEATNA
jgi:biotin operon repressor